MVLHSTAVLDHFVIQATDNTKECWTNRAIDIVNFIHVLCRVEGLFKVLLKHGVKKKWGLCSIVQFVYLDDSAVFTIYNYVINEKPACIRSLDDSVVINLYLKNEVTNLKGVYVYVIIIGPFVFAEIRFDFGLN